MNEQEQIKRLEKVIEDVKVGKLTDWVFLGGSGEDGAKLITSSRPLQQLLLSALLEKTPRKF